ncbi:MAG: helix-turn-helix transcriptional regulator [Spirochaetales bacterium]|nr:helix-turn-helix transcriptional regulator [Spirochaetales bacterium]
MPMPYSSLVIWLTRENTFFDLSGYDYLSLEIEKATTGKVVIFIKTFEKGVSKPEKFEGITLRHNEFTLSITPGISGYNIHINDFLTPDWWFSLMHVPWDKRFKESFKHVSALDFQFIHRSDDPPDGKVQSFIVRNIAFHKSYPFYYIILNIITVLYCILIAASLVINRRSSPSQHHYWDSIMMKIMGLIKEYKVPPLKKLQYRQRELENYADNELTRIMKYLEEHYPDPEISTTLISAETGIPRSHITELIRSEYDCSCRQLINRIRITEAKRLLKTTDRRILEIALEVGFNDISTFNRCFKHGEGISPRQYRARR